MTRHVRTASRAALLGGCAVIGLLGSGSCAPASAADGPAQPAPPEGSTAIQEVIVTAQKRSENLQQVPVAAQVVQAQKLEQQNINGLDTLSQIAPELHVSTGSQTNDIYLRGIGSGKVGTFDQAVGTFVDDIFYGRSRSSAATFLDLDHIEILKGPQSTFFGNNAIAGALNIVTEKPTGTPEGFVRALYGQDGQYALEGAYGGPITDKLSVRIAAISNGTGGWLRDTLTGQKIPADNALAGRVTLLFRPTDDFDATLKIDGVTEKNSGALGLQFTACPPPAPLPVAGNCKLNLAAGLPVGLNNNNVAQMPDQGTRYDNGEAVLTANYRRWGHTFTSVTGYYQLHYVLDVDVTLTPTPKYDITQPDQYHQFSQEFRVTSPADQPITYLAGVYFQTSRDVIDATATIPMLNASLTASTPAIVPYLPIGNESLQATDEQSYAAFGSLSWNVTEQLKLTGNLRATFDHKSFDFSGFYGSSPSDFGPLIPLPPALAALPAVAAAGPLGSGSGARSDHAYLPSGNIQYRITPEAMVYARYDRGFLAGGFTTQRSGPGGSNALDSYKPETVDAFEVGVKSQWFNNTVQLNVDAFRSNYKNLQVQQNTINPNLSGTGIVNVVANAGASLTQGVEADAIWQPVPGLRLSANVAYDDAHFVDYKNVSLDQQQTFCHAAANAGNPLCVAAYGGHGDPGAFQDLSGRPTPFAPKWSANLTESYTKTLANDWRVVGTLSEILSSGYFTDAGLDDPLTYAPGWTRLDGSISFEAPNGRVAVDFIGKNLTNQIIVNNIFYSTLTTGSTYSVKEEPLNVAVQVRAKF